MKKHHDKSSKSSSSTVEKEVVEDLKDSDSETKEVETPLECPLPSPKEEVPVETKSEEDKKPAFTKVTSLPSDSPKESKPEVKVESKSESKDEDKSSKKSKSKTPIWDALKDLEFSLFSLPNKPVSYHVGFISETPHSCFASFAVPAVLPALETNFGKQFTFNVIDKKSVEITKK